MLIIPLKTFSEKSLNGGNLCGRKEDNMEKKIFVALDDWQLTCRNLDELVVAIVDMSNKPYSTATLLEEVRLLAKRECADWVYVRQFGFNNRDEAEAAYIAECKRRNSQD